MPRQQPIDLMHDDEQQLIGGFAQGLLEREEREEFAEPQVPSVVETAAGLAESVSYGASVAPGRPGRDTRPERTGSSSRAALRNTLSLASHKGPALR